MPFNSVTAAWADQADRAGELSLNVVRGEPDWIKVARSLDEVAVFLDQAHQKAKDGFWVVGWIAYEAAPAFDPALSVFAASAKDEALALWMAFSPDRVEKMVVTQPRIPKLSSPWVDDCDTDWFETAFSRVRDWIQAGEFYQINLTTRLRASFQQIQKDSSWKLFQALYLAQPTPFSIYMNDLDRQWLSLSPEQFFVWDGSRLETSPMKGTRKPGDEMQLPLRDSAKDRAENVMIVDLLRNDMARVCEPRSVQVKSLFDIHHLPTVEQMTSTIQGRTRPEVDLVHVFSALFPCGSVTGAPKRQAMWRIAQLEMSPRGVYCGAMGTMFPGGKVRFNVPIRTVTIAGAALSYGVGSGLTWYSEGRAERTEWWQKTNFLRQATGAFEVLETLRMEQGALVRLDDHLRRMQGACARFGFLYEDQKVRAQIADWLEDHPAGAFRVRLRIGSDGNLQCESFVLDAKPKFVKLQLAHRAMDVSGDFVGYKTTWRSHYDCFAPQTADVFDTVLFDGRGFVTESCRFNVVFKLSDRLLTPRMSTSDGANLLNGVFRAALLGENALEEAEISLHDLSRVKQMWLINSLREWVEVDQLIDSQGWVVYERQ